MSFDEHGWKKFSSLGEKEFKQCSFQSELVNLCGGNEDIAWVVYHHHSENSVKWMHSKIPALGNKSPISSLKVGTQSLKKMLWSF